MKRNKIFLKIYSRYKNCLVDDEYDFENILPYFKDPVAYTRSKYGTLMDDLSDKIQYLPEDKRKNILNLGLYSKYTRHSSE